MKITKELLEGMIRDELIEAEIIDFATEKARRKESAAIKNLKKKLDDPTLSPSAREALEFALEELEVEEEEMRDKIARRRRLHTQLVSKPEAGASVEDLMGTSFEDSIARIKARIEKEEDPSKRRDLEKMLAAQERNLAMMTEGRLDDRMRGAGKIHDLLVGALEEQEVFPMGQIPEQVLKAILNLSLRIWDESVVE